MRERAEAIARAQVWREPKTSIGRAVLGADDRAVAMIECRFRFSDLGGTTPKFDCVLPSGTALRVKYGPGPSSCRSRGHASAHRARIRRRYVDAGRTLRCYGCPNEPFVTTKVVDATHTQPLYERVTSEDGYEDFEWAGMEQRFAARPIES